MLWEKDDSLASLAVIGCLCMEAILSDYRFLYTFYIPLNRVIPISIFNGKRATGQ